MAEDKKSMWATSFDKIKEEVKEAVAPDKPKKKTVKLRPKPVKPKEAVKVPKAKGKVAKRKAKVAVSKPLVKQVLPKSKKAKVAKAKPHRRSLDRTLDISTQVSGSVVIISLATGPSVTDLEVAVNGRGVWKGQP